MRRKERLGLLLAGTVLLSGCGRTPSQTDAEQDGSDSGITGKSSSVIGEIDTSEMFSDRDKEVGYDETESVSVRLSDDNSVCESDAVKISGNNITITDEGTYVLSGTLTDGMVIVDAEDTDKIQLVLDGVSISSSQSAALYIASADKVFLTTKSDTENKLENGGTYTQIDDNNIDAAVFSKSDLTLNGEGTLTVTAAAGHGIVSKDDLVFTSGVYEITGEKHGISGKDSVRIADGEYTITSGKDGIHAGNADDSDLGFVYLEDGTFEITASDDGIHSDSKVLISGGNIEIIQSYEGIEGLSIDITGGEISLVASDDGLNAAGGNDGSGFEGPGAGGDQFAVTEGAYISISGGTIRVNASGDGIDSNGDLTVSGGEIYVSGPVNGGNGTLDYSGEASITGGIFAASGAAGMEQNFGNSSTQGVMMVNLGTQKEGTLITLTDSNGTELLSWTAEKTFASVIVSCPEIREGETYTLTAGTSAESITMDSLVYGNGTGQDRGPGNGMTPGDMQRPGNETMPGDMEPPGNGMMPGDMESPGNETMSGRGF